MKAVTINNVPLVKALCEAKADLNKQDKEKNTALIWAARENKIQCVESLVNAKTDLNKQDLVGYTALFWAVHNNHTECAKLLINAGANFKLPNNYIVLVMALERENIEIIQLLLENKVFILNPIKLFDVLSAKSKLKPHQIISILEDSNCLISDTNDTTLLMKAATKNKPSLVKALCEAKVNLNEQDK